MKTFNNIKIGDTMFGIQCGGIVIYDVQEINVEKNGVWFKLSDKSSMPQNWFIANHFRQKSNIDNLFTDFESLGDYIDDKLQSYSDLINQWHKLKQMGYGLKQS